MPAGLYFVLKYFPLFLPHMSLRATVVLVRQFIQSLWWYYNWAWLYLQIFQNRPVGDAQVYQFSKIVSESSGHLMYMYVW